jgi:hypothetical protein
VTIQIPDDVTRGLESVASVQKKTVEDLAVEGPPAPVHEFGFTCRPIAVTSESASSQSGGRRPYGRRHLFGTVAGGR